MIGEGFPNRCRHCDPAPCQLACLPGAISRDTQFDTVLIDPDKCINCASCAMACPYGVIRFHEDPLGPAGHAIALDKITTKIAQAMGAEGIRVDRLEDVGEALNRAVDMQMNQGKTCVLEIMCTRELGDPFRRDALSKPVRYLEKYKDYV